LRSVISRGFHIYDIRVTYEAVVFFVDCPPDQLEQNFDSIRIELVPQNYIPFLQKRGGEYTITVGKRKPIGRKGSIPNIVLLALTLISTTITGAILWAGYYSLPDAFTPLNILNGIIYFVVPLMLILGTHEMGHFIVAKRFKVNASMPYFLPSIPPLGTLGAFISIRDPFPSRKAMLEIGIAGPIAGFLVTIPVALMGFYLTMLNPVHAPALSPGTEVFSVPYLYSLMLSLFPFSHNSVTIFPTAFAAWVGFLATALNLLPAGQLDGGHVSRALLGDNSKYLGWAVVLAMVLLSFEFGSWLLMALFVLILGVRHPPALNDISKLKLNRKMLGAVAAAMFLISFTPIPITQVAVNNSFSLSLPPHTIFDHDSTPQTVEYLSVSVRNTGNVQERINLSSSPSSSPYFDMAFSDGGNYSSFIIITLDENTEANLTVAVVPSHFFTGVPGHYPMYINGRSGSYTLQRKFTVIYT